MTEPYNIIISLELYLGIYSSTQNYGNYSSFKMANFLGHIPQEDKNYLISWEHSDDEYIFHRDKTNWY